MTQKARRRAGAGKQVRWKRMHVGELHSMIRRISRTLAKERFETDQDEHDTTRDL